MAPRLRSQVHHDALQTSISLEEGAVDPQEDWQAKCLEAEGRYEELTRRNDSVVRDLQQQIQLLSLDRDTYKQQLESISRDFENFKVQSELERLRTVENLRDSYERCLADERAQVEKERQRADAWMCDFKESKQLEKRSYEERIRQLEAELVRTSKRVTLMLPDGEDRAGEEEGGADEAATDCATGDRTATSGLGVSGRECTSSVSLHGTANSYTTIGGSGYGSCSAGGQPFTNFSSPIQLPSLPRGPPPLLSIPDVSLTHVPKSPIATATLSSTPAAQAHSVVSTTTPLQSSGITPTSVPDTFRISQASTIPSSISTPGTPLSSQASSGITPLNSTLGASHFSEPFLVQSMTQLLQAQTQMLAAQAQATTVQSLPPISKFSGEDAEQEEKSFKRWLELFEERARLAVWSAEQKLYQLKTHLEKYALQIFHVLPKEEQNDYDTVVKRLKERFRSVDIEELKGIEFHRKRQKGESVEQLGIDLLDLGRKAFPKIVGTEFDRILKDRFFQALHTKWQRKLGAPKPGETFNELYDRARTYERHEQQFTETAVVKGESPKTPVKSASNQASGDKSRGRSVTPSSEKNKIPSMTFQRRTNGNRGGNPRPRDGCFNCGDLNHIARNCPKPATSAEAHGRNTRNPPPRTNVVTISPQLTDFTEEQLEKMLTERRLEKEQTLFKEASASTTAGVQTVTTGNCTANTVGLSPCLNIEIEGVSVTALVDTGSKCTIVSRSLLHNIGKLLASQGKPLPELEEPSITLYGKGGQPNNQKLLITAQVTLTIMADGKSVRAPLFIEPDSDQQCLLGMNVAPLLGLKFTRSNGQPLRLQSNTNQPVALVRLVETSTVPARKGRFLEGQIDTTFNKGQELFFEPRVCMLKELGLSCPESILTVQPNGKLLIPLQNYRGEQVSLDQGLDLGQVESYDNVVKPELEPELNSDPTPTRNSTTGENLCAYVTTGDSRQINLKRELNLPENGLLTSDQQQQLERLILDSADVFSLTDSDLGHTSIVKHTIDSGDHQPIKQHPRRVPFIRRNKIVELVNDMTDRGIVQPSTSAWASPIVLVPKRDGSLRFCVDYRKLNAVTKKDVYPLPRIDDILDTLGNSRYFTTLDLASGYWQIEMDPASQEKSAFVTHHGLFEFRRMPFGLCNAPATFQRLMQTVLAGLEWHCCFIYLDDILVASRTFEEHMEHLRLIFDRLRKADLTLKPRKCFFVQQKVHYLGHVISPEGIMPDPMKTEKVQKFPMPTDVTKVRQFLGLASYYRRFVPGFSSIAAPLHALTKKNVSFQWTAQCQSAFDHLKELLVTAPVLAYPKFGPEEEFVLETDASLNGLGAVLGQRQDDGHVHPIAYASRSLQPHEINYAITELETLALVWAVKTFRPYILGHHCVVLTDHSACTSLLNAAHPSAKLARWAMAIQEHDLEIRHRSGRSNASADALSRNPVVAQPQQQQQTEIASVFQVSSDPVNVIVEDIQHQRFEDIAKYQCGDSQLLPMINYLKSGKLPEDESEAKKLVMEHSQYDLIDDVLHHENPTNRGSWRVVVPAKLQSELLQEMHRGKFSGHFAEKRIYETLRKHYWWKGMRGDVRKYCRSCIECITRRGPGRAIRPPLQSIPVGGPFHRVGVDILQLPLTESGNRYVVVFLDYLTKWVEAFAIPNQSAPTIARIFIEEIFCRHGAPEHLLSDRGANFLSELMQEVCKLLSVKKVNTSGYHPQSDGLVERFNSTLSAMLSKVAETGKDWDRHLPFVLFAYRNSVQESTKESPFYLLYGRDARLPSESVLNQQPSPYTVDLTDYKTEFVSNLSNAWRLAKENIAVAQIRQKKQHDKHAKQHQFKTGDRVMIYMPTAVTGKAWKLARPYHGPYRVVSVTPTNVEATLINDPGAETIFVAVNRVRPCYPEQTDTMWRGQQKQKI